MIIQCPGCHTNYDVGNTLPSEGGNVRCASCNNIWHAKPDTDLPPPTPTTSYENPVFSSEDINPSPTISNTPDIITSESDNAEAASTDRDINFLRDFEPHQTGISSPDIDRRQYFDETENEETTIPASHTDQISQHCETVNSNGRSYSAPASQSFNSNGHDLDPKNSGLTSIADEIEQAIAAEPSPPIEQSQSTSQGVSNLKIISWLTVISLMVGVALFALIDPDRTARTIPATVGLFDAIGIKTNSRGLIIQDVKYEHTSSNERPALQVSGNVQNITNDKIKVPTVVIELRDKDDLILFIWATEVASPNIAPNAKSPFSVLIPAPTKLVRTVKLRFSTQP